MKINGKCHCGAIEYVAEVEPDGVSLCHCTDCQVLCGSPYRASIQTSTLSFTRGAPKIYIKTAQSGNQRAQAFCGDCGSHLYSSKAVDPVKYNLRLGAILERAQLSVSKQSWLKSALPWSSNLESVPVVEPD